MRAVVLFTSFLLVALVATAMAFASFVGGNGSLLISVSPAAVDRPALYTLDGRRSLRLLASSSTDPTGSGAYSPDGTTIAFSRLDASKQKLSLWLMDATGRNRRQIVADVGSPTFAWAPDGKHLTVFTRQSNEIVLVDLLGQQTAIIGRRIRAESIDWAPDGHSIYFEGWQTGSVPLSCRPGICALDVHSGKLRQVVLDDQHLTSWGHYWITVAPDGKRLAFVRDCFSGVCQQLPNPNGLVVTNGNGAHARVLVRGAVGWPVWSPDSSSIAYVDQYTGVGARANTIRVVSVSTGSITRFKAFPAEAAADSPPRVALLSWQPR